MVPKALTDAKSVALANFEKAFAKSWKDGVLLQRNLEPITYPVIPTGSLELDLALGTGGYIRGRLTELYGAYGTGKTTLALIAAAEAQKAYPDEVVGFIDMEHTLDRSWAVAHGVDLDRMYVVEPNSAEDVADLLKEMTDSGLFSLMILDSVGAMIPKEEMEKNAGDVVVGTGAKIITRMVKVSTVQAHRHNVAVLLINQLRANLGANSPMAKKTVKTGGFALSHVTTHMLETRKDGLPIMGGTTAEPVELGQKIIVKVEKNKVAPPKRIAPITLLHVDTDQYGPLGVYRAEEAFLMIKKFKLFPMSGPNITFPGDARTGSREAAIDYLGRNPSLINEVRKRSLATVADQVTRHELEEG